MIPVGARTRPRTQRLREEFLGSAINPRTWAVVDTEGRITVANGEATFAPRTVNSYTDPLLSSRRFPTIAQAGDTFECEIVWTGFGTTGLSFGWDIDNPIIDNLKAGFRVNNTGQLLVSYDTAATAGTATPLFATTAVTLALGVAYRFKIVLLAAGAAYSFSADGGKTWVILWVSEAGGYVGRFMTYGVANSGQSFRLRYIRWYRGPVPTPALSDTFAARTAPGRADTGQPWLIPTGKPIPVIAGDLRIPAGSTESWMFGWDGISDGVWEGDLNFGSAPNTLKAAYILPRWLSANNYIRVAFFRTTQAISIAHIANGTATQVAVLNAAGFLDNTTYRMRVVCIGSVIVVYQDGAEKLRTADAFGQYFGLCSWYLNDNLATPDIRWANVRAWGFPPPPLLADSFDRPDDPTTQGTADTGQAYIPFTDIANIPVFGIEDGRAKLVSAGGPGSAERMARVALKQAAYLCWALLRTRVQGSGVMGFMLRVLDNQNWLALRLQFTSGVNTVVVYKDLATVHSSVSAVGLGGQVPPDTDQLVAVSVAGNVIEYWNNGVRLSSTTITDFATSPAGGLYSTSGSDPRIDDLRYVPLGAALVHDTFTRADSSLTLGNTELPGTPWVPVFGGVWGINSAQAYNVDITPGRGVVLPVLSPDLDVSCDMVHQTGVVGLLLRLGGATLGNDYLLVRFDTTTCSLQERVAAGAIPTLGSTPYAWAASGTPRNVRARIYQGVVSIYVDGALILAQPYSGHAGPTEFYYGLYCSQSTVNTNRFDNFLVREVT